MSAGSTPPLPSPQPSPQPRRLAWGVVAVLAVVAFVMPGSCGEDPPAQDAASRDAWGVLPAEVAGWRVTGGAAPGYVDDKACAECHASEHAALAGHGMGRSFYPPDPATAVEEFGKVFVHDRTRFHYRMLLREGRYVLQRYCEDEVGGKFAEYEAEVAWVVGSGNHGRVYLSQNARGELFQLPLAWYTGVGWGMAPGFDHERHLRFERVVDRACMFCHNAYAELPVGHDLVHREHRFPAQLPHGIGCQRCHGPGARHVEIASAPDASDEAIRARIFNPASLPEGERDRVCLTCHLQPESEAGQFMPPRLDRAMYSHRPDQPITDHFVFLDHGDETERRARFQINHHAYRLRQSTCFTQSGGKLGCLTCHDPHRKVPPAERAAHYRARCATCHRPADCKAPEMGHGIDPAASDCVSCHMHPRRPSDVVQAIVTDHLIQRARPGAAETRQTPEGTHRPGARGVIPYFPELQGKDPRFDVYRGFGTAGSPEAEKAWRTAFERAGPHELPAYVVVGRGLLERGDPQGAVELLRAGRAKFGEVAELEWSLGVARSLAGELGPAIVHLARAAELDPENPGILGSLADAYSQQGDFAKAAPLYRRALDARSNSAQTWRCYGEALFRTGDLAGAAHAFTQAVAQDPDDLDAYRRWATVHDQRGEWKEMVRVLSEGASRRRGLEYDLVMTLLLSPHREARSPSRALSVARALTQRRPGDARAHLYLAFALAGARRPASEVDPVVETAAHAGADPATCAALRALAARRTGDHAGVIAALRQRTDPMERALAEVLQQLHR